MYTHYYNDLEGPNRQRLNNKNNEVTYRTARDSLALKNNKNREIDEITLYNSCHDCCDQVM